MSQNENRQAGRQRESKRAYKFVSESLAVREEAERLADSIVENHRLGALQVLPLAQQVGALLVAAVKHAQQRAAALHVLPIEEVERVELRAQPGQQRAQLARSSRARSAAERTPLHPKKVSQGAQ